MPTVQYSDQFGRNCADLSSVLFTQKRIVFVTDVITDELAADVVQQLLYLASVSDEDITMVINSPGGTVSAGLAIFDVMRGIRCDVSTICIGMAASMGAFLLAAGTKGKRCATPNSEVMIHQIMGGVRGQAVDVQIEARRIGHLKEKINEMLADFTGQTIERIRADTDRDYYMEPEDCVRYGMIDKIRENLMN